SQVLSAGLNIINKDIVHPKWQFSSPALQELFIQYKTLPEGTFEYCVSVNSSTRPLESSGGPSESCLYHRSDGVFLINLVDPSDNARLKEHNPMLSWIANYAFVN